MFDRLELLIGKSSLDILKNSHVLVLGLGGVGGYVVESLVRSGIGEITIIDDDRIDITNINRQIIATSKNIGKFKTLEFNKRIKSIREDITVNIMTKYIDENNIDLLFTKNPDYIIDACDSVKTKQILIKKCLEESTKFITCTGTGNRKDPSKLVIGNLKDTKGDPLARVLRKYLKDNDINSYVPCLYSLETPLRKGEVIASNSIVPPVAGLLITNYVIEDIIKNK